MNKQKTIIILAAVASVLLLSMGAFLIIKSRDSTNNLAVTADPETYDAIPANSKSACEALDKEATLRTLGSGFSESGSLAPEVNNAVQTSTCTFGSDTATVTVLLETYPDFERATKILQEMDDPEREDIQRLDEYGSHAVFITNEPGKSYTLYFQQNNNLVRITTDSLGDASLEKAKEIGSFIKTM